MKGAALAVIGCLAQTAPPAQTQSPGSSADSGVSASRPQDIGAPKAVIGFEITIDGEMPTSAPTAEAQKLCGDQPARLIDVRHRVESWVFRYDCGSL